MKEGVIEYKYEVYPRFSDMDAYGVLHHSKYLLLVEEAKFSFMNEPALFDINVLEEDMKFLISHFSIKYINAIKYECNQSATVMLKFYIEDDIKIIFDFIVYYENKISCTGQAIHVVTDMNNQLMLSLPDKLVKRYQELKGAVA